MKDSAQVRLEVKVPLAEMDEVAKGSGLSAKYFETDALTGDPTTIALVALVSADVIRTVQAFVVAMVKRNKSVEISVTDGKTKRITIKAASLSDAERLYAMLSEQSKDASTHKGK